MVKAESKKDELTTLVEAGSVVVDLSNGRAVTVQEITIKELPAFSRLINKLMGKVEGLDLDNIETTKLVMLALEDADSLIDLIAVGARIPRTDLDVLKLDDLVQLATAVIEVNVEFFIKKILPAIQMSSARLEAKFQPAGQTSLSA